MAEMVCRVASSTWCRTCAACRGIDCFRPAPRKHCEGNNKRADEAWNSKKIQRTRRVISGCADRSVPSLDRIHPVELLGYSRGLEHQRLDACVHPAAN